MGQMSSYEKPPSQPAEKPTTLPKQLDEPVVWLSAAQASTIAAHPGLAALGLALPCWAPQRLVGRALGHGPGGVDAAVAHLGRSYAWATEFENVHSFWRYDEPSLTIGGRVYTGSEAYYQAQKPKPWDKALWDRRKRRVMETALRAKLAADPGGLRALLLATGQHPLLSLKRDEVWGFDPVTARGDNLLAEIWMQVRAEIQLKLDAPAAALAGLNNALVIGISGCTRSGKSTLASALAEALGAAKTAVIRQDRFASKVLAAQAEGGWESTDSIDFKAFRDAVVEASKSKHFVIVEGFRAFASRPPGGVVDLLHHLVWIELSREACYERRMATARGRNKL